MHWKRRQSHASQADQDLHVASPSPSADFDQDDPGTADLECHSPDTKRDARTEAPRYHSSDDSATSSIVAAAAAAGAAAAVALSRQEKGPHQSKSPPPIRTSPTCTSDGSLGVNSPTNSGVVTIEHVVKRPSQRMKKLKKLAIPLIMAIVFLMTGSTAFFFKQWLAIPGLNDQIEQLKEQNSELKAQVERLGAEVDRLGHEVDRLSDENDQFAALNVELAENIAEYEFQNSQLNASLVFYEDLNMQLNASLVELGSLNADLEEQNSVYAMITADLNFTAQDLSQKVGQLENVTEDLKAINDELSSRAASLANETVELSTMNEQLNSSIMTLGEKVNQLETVNTNLATVVSFLNNTATGIQDSFEAVSEFLAEQITAYRMLVTETLQGVYTQRTTLWNCDFRSYFFTEAFANNRSVAIGADSYPDVLSYVEERVLSDLCLNTADFEQFLEAEYVQAPASNVTVNQLLNAVSSYTTDAMAYYFPAGNQTGLTETDWSDASYQCENLSSDKRYKHS